MNKPPKQTSFLISPRLLFDSILQKMSPSVLITGCSAGGAGEALARIFKQNNYTVYATARNLSKIAHLKNEGIEIIALDVLSTDSITTAAAEISSLTGGKLDILINNAGAGKFLPCILILWVVEIRLMKWIGYMTPVLDVDFEKSRKTFDINVFAPFNVAKAFMPLLIASKGTIVNIGSYVDSLPMPWGGVYNASKAALRSLTDNLRLEVVPFGVRVTYVCPSPTFHFASLPLFCRFWNLWC